MKITIFCGGPSSEHDISLKSSETIFRALKNSSHEIAVMYITRSSEAYFFVPQKSLIEEVSRISEIHLEPLGSALQKHKQKIGIALLAGIHGEFAEDGQLQALLDSVSIPFTGSSSISSRLCMDKYLTCQAVEDIECISNPKMVFLSRTAPTLPVIKKFNLSFPVISRPNSLGSSVGITISDSYEDLQLNVKNFHKRYPQQELLISEYISGGVEITCGCLQRKDGSFISLPPVEIIPQGHVFFDYESKYDVGGAKEIIPPPSLSTKMTRHISELACTIHESLGCSTYSRSDFIIKGNALYFIETNTLPGFTETSLFPQETASIGMSLKETLEFIVEN